MNCANHPALVASSTCFTCDTALCDECNLGQGGADPICSPCSALVAADDAGLEMADALTRHQQYSQVMLKKSNFRKIMPYCILIVAVIVLGLLVGKIIQLNVSVAPDDQQEMLSEEL